jgi:hypothetical protein
MYAASKMAASMGSMMAASPMLYRMTTRRRIDGIETLPNCATCGGWAAPSREQEDPVARD